MSYQPFLIAPFSTGLDTDQEPWLLPADAFNDIENGHIHHGYIEKRHGYRELAQMVHGRDISAATTANPAVFTVASATGLSDGLTVTLRFMAGGTWGNLNNLDYTIDNLSGTTFELLDSDGNSVDGSGLGTYTASSGELCIYPAERIMGIFRYISSDNTRETLVSDTSRVGLYNTTNEVIDPFELRDSGGTLYNNADVWTSGDTDYIWACNWQAAGLVNRVYFTNGKEYTSGSPGTDGIVYYDGTANEVDQFLPSLNSTDTLYGAKMLFAVRQRLLALYTFEYNGSSTSSYPQRLRWCAAQDPTNWDDTTPGGGGFVDAPTGEQIISARQVQDIIIVHMSDSVWALRPVPNPSLPFRWEKINSFRSCDGRMASTGFDKFSVAIGSRGITASNLQDSQRIDDRIHDFVEEEINQAQFQKVFGERSYANERTWFLYPKDDSTDANAALIIDDDSRSFAKYLIDMNVLGHGSFSQDLAAQDFTAANNLDIAAQDLTDETASSWFWSDGNELLFGGNTTGRIFVMETLGDDDGTAIPFYLKSAAWNPLREEGSEVQFGYIDIYFNSDQKTVIKIEFFKDDDEVPYKSAEMNLLPDLGYYSDINLIVPNADPSTGFTVSSQGHGRSAGDEVYFYGIRGAEFYNDVEWMVGATITEDSFTVDTDITGYGYAITNITQASPPVVTSAAHGLSDGDVIYIVNVSGMTEVNGEIFIVANTDTNTFELQGADSTGYTAYSSGGYAFLDYQSDGQIFARRFYKTKVWKRAYAGAVGYNHSIDITSVDNNEPLVISAFKPFFKRMSRRSIG